jgi:hypothetical protein
MINLKSAPVNKVAVPVHPKPIVEGWEGLGEDGWEPPLQLIIFIITSSQKNRDAYVTL